MKQAYVRIASATKGYSLLIVLIVIALCSCYSCSNTPGNDKDDTGKTGGLAPHKDSSFLAWAAPGKEDLFNAVIDKFLKNHPADRANYCSSCEGKLVELYGPNVITEAHGQVASGGNKSGGVIRPEGGTDTIGYYSLNYILTKDPMVEKLQRVEKFPSQSSDSPVVNVAVLDSGVDTILLRKNNLWYTGTTASCVSPDATAGWNFVDSNANVSDGFGHGTIVSMIIAAEVARVGKDRVQLLPVKVLGDNGEGDLYSLLCGIAYASERKVDMVNTSLGYYSDTSQMGAGVLLQAFIRHFLTDKGILLVTAAGNGKIVGGDNVSANLDDTLFFPAEFSRESHALNNVFTVTTVGDTGRVVASPRQNISRSVVDIGVMANKIDGKKFYIADPGSASHFVEGTSYATPVVAGMLAGRWSGLKASINGADFNRNGIANQLTADNVLVDISSLSADIKNGKFKK